MCRRRRSKRTRNDWRTCSTTPLSTSPKMTTRTAGNYCRRHQTDNRVRGGETDFQGSIAPQPRGCGKSPMEPRRRDVSKTAVVCDVGTILVVEPLSFENLCTNVCLCRISSPPLTAQGEEEEQGLGDKRTFSPGGCRRDHRSLGVPKVDFVAPCHAAKFVSTERFLCG